MRRQALLLLLSTVLLLTGRAEGAGRTIRRLDGTRITVDAASALARETLTKHNVTGAQIAVVDRGRLVWSEAFGMRSLEPPLPMERTTTTWAASITKGLFATYVMQLVERGEFDLDQAVVELLPRPLHEYEPYREKAELLADDPRWRRVTPRMLLAHTSGLLNFASMEPDKKMRLHFAPGDKYFYSGEGINLLQFVVEQKKGRALDLLMQEAIFTPLGMTRTGLIFRNEFEADIADRFDAEGKFRAKTRRNPARAAAQ